jgi:hypothetical protein
MLEAVGIAKNSTWRYAFVRSTVGGLEMKLGREVVWTAKKNLAQRIPTLPHFTIQRDH